MENSGKIKAPAADADEAVWFVVQSDRWVGPFTVQEVLEKIEAREVSFAHFMWKQGFAGFKRVCDLEEFKAALPPEPSPSLIKKSSGPPPVPSKDASEKKNWFLHYNESQFGPFAKSEVVRFLQVGKIHKKVHAWKDGMEDWAFIEQIPDFHLALSDLKTADKPVKNTIKEQRNAPRRPLVARIFVVKDESVIVAVCRDISVGGMQVLTDRIPGPPGTRVKMNVSPSGGELGGQIRPFVAEGLIVRVMEDHRGFSFRFERLPDDAKRAIENYIASTD